MVNITLWRAHAARQIEFCSDGREVPGVGLDSVLEAAFRRVGREHRPGREVGRIDPTGNAFRAAVERLIGVNVEWWPERTADNGRPSKVCGLVRAKNVPLSHKENYSAIPHLFPGGGSQATAITAARRLFTTLTDIDVMVARSTVERPPPNAPSPNLEPQQPGDARARAEAAIERLRART